MTERHIWPLLKTLTVNRKYEFLSEDYLDTYYLYEFRLFNFNIQELLARYQYAEKNIERKNKKRIWINNELISR